MPLRLGEVLYESGVLQEHVYFPIDCIVSLLRLLLEPRRSYDAHSQQDRCRVARMPTDARPSSPAPEVVVRGFLALNKGVVN